MKRNYKKQLILAILIILMIVSTIYVIYFFRLKFQAKEESNLLNSIKIERMQIPENSKEKVIITERMLQVKELQKQNSDIVGWIEIEGTNINYPVLQGTDNEYYLDHDYKHEKTAKGSIFLNKDYDWNIPSTNLLIYGHNMKNGEMFEDLLNYSSEEYYKNHPIIRFTTANEDKEYEIFSAFRARVYYKSETNVFRYYNFINANIEEEYNEFIKNAKSSALYDTGINEKKKKKLITLITCSYHVNDGRFVVIGKEK